MLGSNPETDSPVGREARAEAKGRVLERLTSAGKLTKAASIATARKLLVTLDAMLATGTSDDPTTAS